MTCPCESGEWTCPADWRDPDAGRDDVLEDEGLEEDTRLERPEPWLYRVGARVRLEWAQLMCWYGMHTTCPHAHTTQALA